MCSEVLESIGYGFVECSPGTSFSIIEFGAIGVYDKGITCES
jgi:hypothetical protein